MGQYQTTLRKETEYNRRRMSEALNEEGKFCKKIIDHSPQSITIINEKFFILYSNDAIRSLLGIENTEGKCFLDLVAKAHCPRLQTWLSKGSVGVCDVKLKQGKRKSISVSISAFNQLIKKQNVRVLFLSENEKATAQSALRDLEKINADLLATLSKARNSERIYRAIGESINYGVWVCDPEGRNIYTSPSFLRMVGLTQEACSDFGWTNKLHPDDAAQTVDAWQTCVRSEGKWDRVHRYYGVDGNWHPTLARGAPVRDDNGNILCWAGINLDISEIQQATQALKESEARFRAAQDASLDCFVIYTPIQDKEGKLLDLRIIYANRMMGEHYNTTAEKLVGRLISDVLPVAKEPGGLIDRHARIIESDKAQEYLLSFDVNGTTRYFRNLVVPFKPYVATTFRDVTDMVVGTNALAAAKAAAERLALARSKFLATASHDLRQPVQTLVLLLAMLKTQETSPAFNKVLLMAENALEGLKSLMNSILNISRLDAGLITPELTSINAGELLKRLSQEYVHLANDKGLNLRVVRCSLRIHTDPILLERALRNLIENAIRYTEKGGIVIGARRRGNTVRIDVVDTGIGIPVDKQSQVFEEFYQMQNESHRQGLGLGLSIVSRIATLLRAQVQVSSRERHGSRFSISLPLDNHAPEQPALQVESIKKDGGRILIIEDNADVRTGLQLLTEGWGYQSVAASSGEEALLLCSTDTRFDAIMADHRLGRGIMGTETVKKICEQAGKKIPSVIITGDTASEQLTEIQASGFDVLFKPVGAMELRRKLEQLMQARK